MEGIRIEIKNKEKMQSFGKHGWLVVIYCLLMFWFYVGMVNDGTNITAPAFAAKTGIPYPDVLAQGTTAGLVGVLFFLVVGKINEKIGPRITSAACLVIAGIAYIFLGRANSLLSYTIALCFVTGTAMSAGYIAGGTLVAKWFPKKKGIVMGWTTMGHNLASAFYVPFINILVTRLGIKNGVIFPAVLVVILGIVGFFLIRNDPSEREQYPDNVSKETYENEYFTGKVDATGGWTTSKLLKAKDFWLAAFTTGGYQLVTVGIMTQLVHRNVELGFTIDQAILLMTILACIGVVGSWLVGVLDQKVGTKKAMVVFGIWYIFALIFNLLETQPFIYLSVFMIGMSIGGSANFTTSLPAAIFGRHGFERVNSAIFPVQGLITSMNFLVSAISVRLIGTLRGAYMMNIGFIVVIILLVLMVDEHRYNKDFMEELTNTN